MTRNEIEQVEKHFDELHAIATGITPDIKDDIRQAIKAAYIAGADYAVDMFATRWISVEDALPEKGDIVIVVQDAYGNIHFTACEFISAMQLCDVTDFHVRSDAYLGITKKAEVTLGAVTHWMPLPQPPSCSEFPNYLKEGGEQ